MKKIVIMAGHQNSKFNSIVALRGSTGAPGEVEFNIDVANQVSARLRERGFEVKQTDANANDDTSITQNDWDLVLAIHYDADIYNDSGGFVDFPEPSTDKATVESQRIAGILSTEYFKVTGIKNKPLRSNPNTRFYYMWKFLTPKTPCAIIECGVGWRVPDDHNLFTYERGKVVEGIVKGICKAFEVPYQLPPSVDEQIKIAVKEAVNKALSENNALWQTRLDTANEQIRVLSLQRAEDMDWKTLFSIAWKKWWASKRG